MCVIWTPCVTARGRQFLGLVDAVELKLVCHPFVPGRLLNYSISKVLIIQRFTSAASLSILTIIHPTLFIVNSGEIASRTATGWDNWTFSEWSGRFIKNLKRLNSSGKWDLRLGYHWHGLTKRSGCFGSGISLLPSPDDPTTSKSVFVLLDDRLTDETEILLVVCTAIVFSSKAKHETRSDKDVSASSRRQQHQQQQTENWISDPTLVRSCITTLIDTDGWSRLFAPSWHFYFNILIFWSRSGPAIVAPFALFLLPYPTTLTDCQVDSLAQVFRWWYQMFSLLNFFKFHEPGDWDEVHCKGRIMLSSPSISLTLIPLNLLSINI